MSKKAKQRQPTPAGRETGPASKGPRRGGAGRRRWTLGHLLVAFALGLAVGGAFGYTTADRAAGTAVDESGQQIERVTRTDRFGRSPGHAHYMHDHP